MAIVVAANDFVSDVAILAQRLDYESLPGSARDRSGFLFCYTEDQYRDLLRTVEFFYVMLTNNVVTGFVLAQTAKNINENDGELYNYIKSVSTPLSIIVRQIAVDPSYSNRGYGRALYRHLFRNVQSMIPESLDAYTFIWNQPPNRPSARFHAATGWSCIEAYELQNRPDNLRKAVGIWRYSLNSQDDAAFQLGRS